MFQRKHHLPSGQPWMELGSWADSRYQQQYTIQPSPQASLPNAFVHLMPSMEQTEVQTQHPFLLSSNALTPHPHLPQTKIGKFLCTSSLTFIYFPTQYLSLHHFLHIFCLTSHPLHNILSYPTHIPSPSFPPSPLPIQISSSYFYLTHLPRQPIPYLLHKPNTSSSTFLASLTCFHTHALFNPSPSLILSFLPPAPPLLLTKPPSSIKLSLNPTANSQRSEIKCQIFVTLDWKVFLTCASTLPTPVCALAYCRTSKNKTSYPSHFIQTPTHTLSTLVQQSLYNLPECCK